MTTLDSAPAERRGSLVRRLLAQPREFWRVLWEIGGIASRHRRLTLFMAKREITDAFAGSIFGVLWTVLHPLIRMMVLVVVFALIFRGRVPQGDLNPYGYKFAVHMISGFLAWSAFTEVIIKSCTVVRGSGRVFAKQVVFPIEILPIKTVLASIVPQLIGTVFLIGYTVLVFGSLPWTWVFWPVFLFFEIVFLCGLAYGISAVGVFIRDLREVLVVATMILFYVSPILYSEMDMPTEDLQIWLAPAIQFNPVSYLVWPFRDMAFHGSLAHPQAWVGLPIGSVIVLVFGYRVFRKLKPMFGNAL